MKIGRLLLWGLGIATLLVVIGLIGGSIWLDSFIHSDAFRHDVEARISRTVGGPIEIRQIDFNLLSGAELKGLGAKLVTPQGTVITRATSVKCDYSVSALLARKLQLDGVTLVDPQIVLTQRAPATVPIPTPPPVVTGSPSPQAAPGGKTAPFQVILKEARITNGRFSIQDDTGATKADLQGFQAHADTSGYFEGKDATGELTIANIALPANLRATDFSTSFRYRSDSFEASPFKVSSFTGQLTGDYRLPSTGPSVLRLDATHIDLAQAGQAATPDAVTKLSGLLGLQSNWTGIESGKLLGEGTAAITGGNCVGMPILHELAKAFQLPEMSDPDLKSVRVHFRLADGITRFDHLQINSTVFDMEGSGVIDSKGHLSARMTLTLNDDAMLRIPREAVPFFKKAPGGSTIPFQLTGTIDNPESDSLTRIFIQSSKVKESIKNTFNTLFR